MAIQDYQVTNKQHAVPQNIMDVEFKLIGDLTMRQFAYLIIFGGIAWVCFSTMKGAFRIPFTGFFALFGLGLAFFTIGDRGMDQWVVNFLRSMYSPTQKVWKKDPIIPSIFLYQNLAVVKQEIITLAPTTSRRKLEEYLQYQTTSQKVDNLDIPELSYTQMIRDAYTVSDVSIPSTTTSVTTTFIEPELVEPTVSDNQAVAPKQPSANDLPQKPQEEPTKELTHDYTKPIETPVAANIPVSAPASVSTAPKVQQEPKRKHISVPKLVLPSHRDSYISLSPMTPDMHSGRVFTNLLPGQSDIVLPVRGEKILKPSEEADIERDIEQKADQLRKLIEQIKQDETYKKVIVPTKPAVKAPEQVINLPNNIALETTPMPTIPLSAQPTASVDISEPKEVSEAGNILESLKSENVFLNKEIERLRSEIEKSTIENSIETATTKKVELEKLQKAKEDVSSEVQTIQSTLSDIQEKIQRKKATVSNPTYAAIQPLTTRPNIISGVVQNGSTKGVLEGIVLIIKNQKGEPVRALKTNKLGQFSISTPLSNGSYTVEIDSSNKTGLLFDIISVEVKGLVIPPIEFVGK